MYKYRVSFLSLSLNLIFDFKSRVKKNKQKFVEDIMEIYAYINSVNQLSIDPLQVNNVVTLVKRSAPLRFFIKASGLNGVIVVKAQINFSL